MGPAVSTGSERTAAQRRTLLGAGLRRDICVCVCRALLLDRLLLLGGLFPLESSTGVEISGPQRVWPPFFSFLLLPSFSCLQISSSWRASLSPCQKARARHTEVANMLQFFPGFFLHHVRGRPEWCATIKNAEHGDCCHSETRERCLCAQDCSRVREPVTR